MLTSSFLILHNFQGSKNFMLLSLYILASQKNFIPKKHFARGNVDVFNNLFYKTLHL
jgi:hypothetical protein